MATKDQLRTASTSGGRLGVDLMRKISEGSQSSHVPSDYLQNIRSAVIESCDELLEIGARIRPILVDGKKIGWVRGIHNTERRRLSRWITDSNEYIVAVLTLSTTLTREEIIDLSSLELRNIVELVQKMSEYDFSLFPYLSAFTSTLASENLWHGRGTQLTSFENKIVELPDGKTMKIIVPSDHARLWATLCVYREQAKVRLDASWNAVLGVRPMAGKSVDPLASELKANSKYLATNSIEPWEDVVKYRPSANLDDGWAHAENLETREGMLKELHGMLANDRHEQLMAKFEKQQIDAADERRKAIEAIVAKRGGPGINEETIEVLSEADVRQKELDLKKGRVSPKPINREKTETVANPVDKMKRYQ